MLGEFSFEHIYMQFDGGKPIQGTVIVDASGLIFVDKKLPGASITHTLHEYSQFRITWGNLLRHYMTSRKPKEKLPMRKKLRKHAKIMIVKYTENRSALCITDLSTVKIWTYDPNSRLHSIIDTGHQRFFTISSLQRAQKYTSMLHSSEWQFTSSGVVSNVSDSLSKQAIYGQWSQSLGDRNSMSTALPFKYPISFHLRNLCAKLSHALSADQVRSILSCVGVAHRSSALPIFTRPEKEPDTPAFMHSAYSPSRVGAIGLDSSGSEVPLGEADGVEFPVREKQPFPALDHVFMDGYALTPRLVLHAIRQVQQLLEHVEDIRLSLQASSYSLALSYVILSHPGFSTLLDAFVSLALSSQQGGVIFSSPHLPTVRSDLIILPVPFLRALYKHKLLLKLALVKLFSVLLLNTSYSPSAYKFMLPRQHTFREFVYALSLNHALPMTILHLLEPPQQVLEFELPPSNYPTSATTAGQPLLASPQAGQPQQPIPADGEQEQEPGYGYGYARQDAFSRGLLTPNDGHATAALDEDNGLQPSPLPGVISLETETRSYVERVSEGSKDRQYQFRFLRALEARGEAKLAEYGLPDSVLLEAQRKVALVEKRSARRQRVEGNPTVPSPNRQDAHAASATTDSPTSSPTIEPGTNTIPSSTSFFSNEEFADKVKKEFSNRSLSTSERLYPQLVDPEMDFEVTKRRQNSMEEFWRVRAQLRAKKERKTVSSLDTLRETRGDMQNNGTSEAQPSTAPSVGIPYHTRANSDTLHNRTTRNKSHLLDTATFTHQLSLRQTAQSRQNQLNRSITSSFPLDSDPLAVVSAVSFDGSIDPEELVARAAEEISEQRLEHARRQKEFVAHLPNTGAGHSRVFSVEYPRHPPEFHRYIGQHPALNTWNSTLVHRDLISASCGDSSGPILSLLDTQRTASSPLTTLSPQSGGFSRYSPSRPPFQPPSQPLDSLRNDTQNSPRVPHLFENRMHSLLHSTTTAPTARTNTSGSLSAPSRDTEFYVTGKEPEWGDRAFGRPTDSIRSPVFRDRRYPSLGGSNLVNERLVAPLAQLSAEKEEEVHLRMLDSWRERKLREAEQEMEWESKEGKEGKEWKEWEDADKGSGESWQNETERGAERMKSGDLDGERMDFQARGTIVRCDPQASVSLAGTIFVPHHESTVVDNEAAITLRNEGKPSDTVVHYGIVQPYASAKLWDTRLRKYVTLDAEKEVPRELTLYTGSMNRRDVEQDSDSNGIFRPATIHNVAAQAHQESAFTGLDESAERMEITELQNTLDFDNAFQREPSDFQPSYLLDVSQGHFDHDFQYLDVPEIHSVYPHSIAQELYHASIQTLMLIALVLPSAYSSTLSSYQGEQSQGNSSSALALGKGHFCYPSEEARLSDGSKANAMPQENIARSHATNRAVGEVPVAPWDAVELDNTPSGWSFVRPWSYALNGAIGSHFSKSGFLQNAENVLRRNTLLPFQREPFPLGMRASINDAGVARNAGEVQEGLDTAPPYYFQGLFLSPKKQHQEVSQVFSLSNVHNSSFFNITGQLLSPTALNVTRTSLGHTVRHLSFEGNDQFMNRSGLAFDTALRPVLQTELVDAWDLNRTCETSVFQLTLRNPLKAEAEQRDHQTSLAVGQPLWFDTSAVQKGVHSVEQKWMEVVQTTIFQPRTMPLPPVTVMSSLSSIFSVLPPADMRYFVYRVCLAVSTQLQIAAWAKIEWELLSQYLRNQTGQGDPMQRANNAQFEAPRALDVPQMPVLLEGGNLIPLTEYMQLCDPLRIDGAGSSDNDKEIQQDGAASKRGWKDRLLKPFGIRLKQSNEHALSASTSSNIDTKGRADTINSKARHCVCSAVRNLLEEKRQEATSGLSRNRDDVDRDTFGEDSGAAAKSHRRDEPSDKDSRSSFNDFPIVSLLQGVLLDQLNKKYDAPYAFVDPSYSDEAVSPHSREISRLLFEKLQASKHLLYHTFAFESPDFYSIVQPMSVQDHSPEQATIPHFQHQRSRSQDASTILLHNSGFFPDVVAARGKEPTLDLFYANQQYRYPLFPNRLRQQLLLLKELLMRGHNDPSRVETSSIVRSTIGKSLRSHGVIPLSVSVKTIQALVQCKCAHAHTLDPRYKVLVHVPVTACLHGEHTLQFIKVLELLQHDLPELLQ